MVKSADCKSVASAALVRIQPIPRETEVVTLPYRHSESRAHAKLSTQKPMGEGRIRKLNRRVRFSLVPCPRGKVVLCKRTYTGSSPVGTSGRTSRRLATALVLKTDERRKLPWGFDPLFFRYASIVQGIEQNTSNV